MKTLLLTGWTAVRWMRLGLAVFLLWGAFANHDTLAGVLGGFLLLQVAFNTGCCGVGGCATPATQASVPETDDLEVTFEEVTPPTRRSL